MRLFIIFITLCAHAQSSPLPRSDQHQKVTNLAVVEDAMFNSTTPNPMNATLQPLDVENTTTVHEEGNAGNLTTDPWKDLETTETDDDVNWSQEPTDGMKHSDAECVSQRTRSYLASPCGVREPPRRSVCNINNIFHVKQGAKMLLQTLTNFTFDGDSGIPDIKLDRLSKTTPLDAQLKELENSLQTYFLYLSEASSIYSAKFSQLKSLQFDFIRHNLLSVLCDLDNGMPIVPPSLTTCLSRDSTTFLSQTIYILQCLHTDATVAMTWDRCHTN